MDLDLLNRVTEEWLERNPLPKPVPLEVLITDEDAWNCWMEGNARTPLSEVFIYE